MQLITPFNVVLTLLAASTANALGINCNGGGGCKSVAAIGGTGTRLAQIFNAAQEADDNREYALGEHIACVENGFNQGICAFFQNNAQGRTGFKAKQLLQDLLNHGCTACGSVPRDFPNVNDVTKGELTVNVVSKASCKGLC